MIDENRIKHILGVARLMKEKAKLLGLDEEEMFLLGYLHDFGYETGDIITHPEIGGKLLKAQGYKYYQEVFYHGDINTSYESKELDLLNWCDLHINSCGKFVSFEERLEDIKTRRGEDSEAYKMAKTMVKKLGKLDYLVNEG